LELHRPESVQFIPSVRDPLDKDPLKRLVQQGRWAVILRDAARWSTQTDGSMLVEKTKTELEQRMALVPNGTVSINSGLTAELGGSCEETEIKPFLLDVETVTNGRFQKFVDAGCYDELDYWPEDIWPHLIEFKDLTGAPGPRYWRNGRHNALFADHPVVGISWYEAKAFTQWIGQRLPTEAEWQMAASWHVNSAADLLRRFPWGDAMDNSRCNIWSSRKAGTVPVSEYPNGVAPNHVLQLIGNVWEWTDSEFAPTDSEGRPIIAEMPMQAIRGGAYDTYFETQATSQFRSGQISLGRWHNVGFRCAMELSQATWLDDE